MTFKFSEKISEKAKKSFEEKFMNCDETTANSFLEFLDGVYEEHKNNAAALSTKAVEEYKAKQAEEAKELESKRKSEAKAAAEANQKAFGYALSKNAVKIKRLFSEVDSDDALAAQVSALGNTVQTVDFLAKLGDKFEYNNGPQGGRKTDEGKVKTHEEVVREQLKKQGIVNESI
jgi:hypothetical protein